MAESFLEGPPIGYRDPSHDRGASDHPAVFFFCARAARGLLSSSSGRLPPRVTSSSAHPPSSSPRAGAKPAEKLLVSVSLCCQSL
jgi:hypothetical protein